MSVPHNFEEDFSQKDPFVRHLEESIREKKANLECPVCLEVIDSYFNLSRGSDTFCLVELSLMIKPILVVTLGSADVSKVHIYVIALDTTVKL